ncbi:MAG: zf-HC2 domain-containing protein [Gemmatimonadetes bacterium]|nr:zf-HC2 domain-containing protein [Gemmatimonadota bacterium]
MMQATSWIRCEDALARLWDFLDGELPPDEEVAVRKHLEICNRCYPRYDFRRAYFEYARRVGEKEHTSPELRRRLFQEILEQEAKNGLQ